MCMSKQFKMQININLIYKHFIVYNFQWNPKAYLKIVHCGTAHKTLTNLGQNATKTNKFEKKTYIKKEKNVLMYFEYKKTKIIEKNTIIHAFAILVVNKNRNPWTKFPKNSSLYMPQK